LVRYPPRVNAGAEPVGLALTTDLAPTIVELAGAPAMPGIDGRSLVPLFARTPADWRKSFLIEYTTDIVFPRTLKMGYDAVRTERYKYIRYRDLRDMNELYDLLEDPFELSNLIAAPTATAARQQMEKELDRILASARSPLP
jgi:arylsulfatase A-like enzyme